VTLLPAITHREYAHSNQLVPIGPFFQKSMSCPSPRTMACSVKIQHPGGVGLARILLHDKQLSQSHKTVYNCENIY
jgi:hypothetical protein